MAKEKKQGVTSKSLDRAGRQENLREQLSGQKHIEKVIDNIEKIENLNFFPKGADSDEIDYKVAQSTKFRLDALRTANEQRLKLINKYLPDLKNTEITGEAGGSLTIKVTEYSSKDD